MHESNSNGTHGSSRNRKYIGYRGEWYDVTSFIKHHPGGEVIEKFIGHDATHVMETTHGRDVLRTRKPATYDPNVNGTPKPYHYEPSLFGKQMLALHHRLVREGYYENSIPFFVRKVTTTISIFVIIFVLLLNYGHAFFVQCLCSFLLALFWQQSGILMHDLMHSHAFQNYKIDEYIGVFFGTVCLGISSRWWKDEHTLHHALTNTVDYASGFVDPQAYEDVWAQNEKLFPFMREKIHKFLIKVQFWTFIPACVLVGRFGLVVDSYRQEKRKDVWMAFVLHNIWMATFFYLLPSWKVRFLFYYGASVGEGVLHVQLLLNHYSKRFFEKDVMHQTEFFRAMVDVNLNIVCPGWLDWFHGGLNFHIEHHCFPRLPRNRSREVSKMIKKICAEHDIVYDECSFTCAIKRTLLHLSSVSKLYQAMKGIEHTVNGSPIKKKGRPGRLPWS